MKKKLRHFIPAICLGGGWIFGISFFYLSDILGLNSPVYYQQSVTFSGVMGALGTQIKLFILVCLSGFSMFSGIIPAAIVLIRSFLAAFSCAAVYGSFTQMGILEVAKYSAFALTSALICVFLTSSARLADIFYTKVPHNKPENVLDYLARQTFTIGFATIILLIYFILCKLLQR